MSKGSKPWWQTEGVWDGPGQHEPIAFIRRRGGAREDIADLYEEHYSDETARRTGEAGYNFVESCFFKGLGLEAEAFELKRTKRFVKALQKNGVRAGVYTQWGSIFNETFFQEIPEAREWVQIGVDGKPIEYGDTIHQYFRWRGCPGNPDFIAFIKRVCKLAIEDYGVDVIYFDNMCLFEGHDTLCYCEHCRKGFKAYLAKKFPTPESSWERMGLWRVDGVEPPPFHPWRDYTVRAQPIADPVMQEFIEFRCEQFAAAWQDVFEYIQSVSPKVGLMGNPSFPRKYNERLTSAIDFWRLRKTPAFYYMENAVSPVGVREGALSSNARGYKYGRALGLTFVPCGGSHVPGLIFCEGLAFNDGSGTLGHEYEPFFEFFKEHRDEFYRGVEPAADVAVLRHDVSLTWRWHETYTVMEQAQQQLLCGGIPWMPVWGQQLLDGTLGRYKVLVVPGCGCLSRAELDAIYRFAESGGVVVVLENAGCFDEYHHTIATWRFAKLFASAADADGFAMRYAGFERQASFKNQRLLHARYGAGRAIYLPQIRTTREPVRGYDEIGGYNGLQHLRLPATWRVLPKAIEKAAGAKLSVKVAGPPEVLAEVLRKTDTGEVFVHLVNYDEKKARAGVELVLADAGQSAALYVPDAGIEGKELRVTAVKGGGAKVRLPGFTRYAMVVLRKE